MRVTPDLQLINSFNVKADNDVSREPRLAFDGTNYMVVWSDGTFGGDFKVQAARVTTQGVVLDSGVVFGMDAENEYGPAIAFDGSRYLAIWYNYDYTPAGVFGRLINTSCEPEGREITIRFLATSALMELDIAFFRDYYLTVWSEPSPQYDDDIYGQLIDQEGNLIGSTIPIANGSAWQYHPRISYSDSLYLVIWNQDNQVWGQYISPDGVLIDSNFTISDTTDHLREYPAVSFGLYNFLVAWQQYEGNNYDIYGNLDIEPGIQETNCINKPISMATIFSETLIPWRSCRIFDISGRRVESDQARPGVYFIMDNEKSLRKVVKIR